MIFKIGELHPNTPHLFADLVELLVLIGYDGRSSYHKNDIQSVLTRTSVSLDEADEELAAERVESSDAIRQDRGEKQLEDVWTQLSYRARGLRPFYPFRVKGDEIFLITDNLSVKQRVYRLLLACSRLRSFDRGSGARQRWAKGFACLSKYALKGLMPAHAAVRVFDANSDDRRDYYSTNLREALRVLGNDLGVLSINDEECNNTSTSGDAGLDLVGVIDMEDGATVNFAVLGQCGAQEDEWPSKTLEAHPIHFRSIFQMQFEPPSVMFTPVCYRSATGQWVNNRNTNGILLIDRVRILKLIEKQDSWEAIENAPWLESFENDFNKVIPPD